MKIILYTNNCPKCKVLKQKLDEKNIVYDICDDVNLMLEKGFKTVPILEINNEIMNFNDAIKRIKGE